MAGCAATVEVRPLATGRVDIAAYELRGSELAPLRREAQRLCPAGAEVVRQTVSGTTSVDMEDTVWSRWWVPMSLKLSPTATHAQMTVQCRPAPQDRVIDAAKVPAHSVARLAAMAQVDAATDGMPQPVATAPIGPVMPEW
jgi:hypothetical protein